MSFIFRSPFVTRRQRSLANSYITLAQFWGAIADCEKLENGNFISSKYVTYVQKMQKCMYKAARQLGFRNVHDMDKYLKIHGKF